MFRTLLTPLRLRFDSSPRSAVINPVATPSIPDEEELDPEDFARDVLIELMRISVDRLKLAESTKERIETLAEIQRIMTQDALGATKDVFREMDGFVGLMSALSMASPDDSDDTKECCRLAFVITSDAITEHAENAVYFKTRVGYPALATAIQSLVSSPSSKPHTLSLLLSLSFANFSLLNAFSSPAALLATLPRLSTIKRPGAFALLVRFASLSYFDSGDDDPGMRHAVLKMYEHLASSTHRNHVVLSSPALALAPLLLARFLSTSPSSTLTSTSASTSDTPALERAVLAKLLRRLLDMGATPPVARLLFQRVVVVRPTDPGDSHSNGNSNGPGETLDAELLEVIRYAMKSRWLEHFSMESPAALTLGEEGVRGLPVGGFTFMIWLWIRDPPTTAHTLFSARLPASSSLNSSNNLKNNANPHSSASNNTNKGKAIITLSLRPDGKLELSSSANRDVGVFRKSSVQRQRWTHVALVCYAGAGRGVGPSIRLYIDGVLTDGLNWAYPKSESAATTVAYCAFGGAWQRWEWGGKARQFVASGDVFVVKAACAEESGLGDTRCERAHEDPSKSTVQAVAQARLRHTSTPRPQNTHPTSIPNSSRPRRPSTRRSTTTMDSDALLVRTQPQARSRDERDGAREVLVRCVVPFSFLLHAPASSHPLLPSFTRSLPLAPPILLLSSPSLVSLYFLLRPRGAQSTWGAPGRGWLFLYPGQNQTACKRIFYLS
ncbi:hypothetical protein C8R47DRAFT_1252556 [Mycena vitilis]|nr:hypothetical protein C8R47DRAFT_1252556 [Mycena vitilis]